MDQNHKKHEDLVRLISEIRNQPCLWDTNLEESKSVNARKVAFEEIANRLNLTSEDIRRKLHNLRSQYRRENIRMANRRTTKPKWIYFDMLNFLGPTFKKKQKVPNYLNPLDEASKSISDGVGFNFDLDDHDILAEDENSIAMQPNNIDEIPLEMNDSISFQQDKLFSQTDTDNDDRSSSISNRKVTPKRVIVLPRQNQHEDDEYTTFGENVANELRSLEYNKNLQRLLKCNILQAILEVNKSLCNNAVQQQTTQNTYISDENNLAEFLILTK